MATDHIRYDVLATDAMRGVVRKVLTYALGRSLVTSPGADAALDDAAGVADLQKQTTAPGGTLARLVDLVARSPAMTMRIGDVQP